MPLRIDATSRTQTLTRTALLAAFGLVMFLFEAKLPRPLPWAKPGLANLATLLALYMMSARSAWAVTFIRVFTGSLIIGTFGGPSFWLSLAGGVCSCGVMLGLRRFATRWFSVIGLSLAGALAHVLAQMSLVALVLIPRLEIIRLLPLMLWPALAAGLIVGLIAFLLLERFGITS